MTIPECLLVFCPWQVYYPDSDGCFESWPGLGWVDGGYFGIHQSKPEIRGICTHNWFEQLWRWWASKWNTTTARPVPISPSLAK